MRIFAVFLMAASLLNGGTSPVLVELFTSEGCSSCPPADLFLSHLQKDQPVAGVEIITLSEHVDYWNQLGWTDPFSSHGFTERQARYAESLRGEGPYTPQMVVDGSKGFVGSDSHKVLLAIVEAAKAPKASIELHCGGSPLRLGIQATMVQEDSDVLLALTENGLASNVARGENRGRTMAHDGVTRRLTMIGFAKKQAPFEAKQKIAIESGWKRENLSAVVFLQGRSSHRVLGASRIALPVCAAD